MSGPGGDKDRRKRRRGMTMAEVAASLAIVSLIMIGAMKAMTVSARMFHDIAESARQRRVTESLGEMIREQLTFAGALEIDAGGGAVTEDAGQIIFTEDGRVLWNGEELYQNDRFFCSVNLPEGQGKQDALDLTLFLENNRKEALYSHRTVVKLVNLELHDREGISVIGEAADGGLDSHDQEICFRFQSPGEEYLQEE